MPKPTETKSVAEESSFEIIGDSQSIQNSIPAPASSLHSYLDSPLEMEKETGQTVIRCRRNKQTKAPVPASEKNEKPKPKPKKNLETRVKSKSKSESESESESEPPTTATGAATQDKLKDEENLGLEKELKKLKAKVKSLTNLKWKVKKLMKFKARVQGREQSDESDDSDDSDESDKDYYEDDDDEDQIAAKNEDDKNPPGAVEKKAAKPKTIQDYFAETLDNQKFIAIIQALICGFLFVLFLIRAAEFTKGNKTEIESKKPSITNTIYLYSEKNFEGLKILVLTSDLNQNTCYNLDTNANDFASSIDTQEQCVYIFKNSDCRGKSVKVHPETPFQHDLSLWGLDKAISSIQACYKHKG